ncbi:MAG TPA: AAA family ATPase, partial [Saprospiraceae bacterium]|nr:AAA family ATPase [Saprospiraceae bacterium]
MHFLLLCGPPAVGKMTIGREIASRTGFKLFHNHHSIEFALNYFDFGDPEFAELNEGLRQLVFSTVAKSQQLSGFIFTLVWAFNEQEDWDYVRDLVNRFTNNGWTFSVVELYAPLKIRHERNKTPLRLA